MYRLTCVARLSQSAASAGWGGRHASRFTKEALYHSRLRGQCQQQNFALQQSLNEDFGSHQRHIAKQRDFLSSAAMGLVHGSKSRARGTHRTPRDSADEMGMARQLLMMQEAARRGLKQGKARRTEEFRALKRSR